MSKASPILRSEAFHNESAATRYWPSEDGARLLERSDLVLYFAVSGGVTVTIEFANTRDDNSAPYSTDWQDVTEDFKLVSGKRGVTYVDCTRQGVITLPRGRWRIKRVTSDATNDSLFVAQSEAAGAGVGLIASVDALACAERRAAATTTLASDPHDLTAAPFSAGFTVDTDGVYKFTCVGDAVGDFVLPYLLKGIHYPYAISRIWATGSPAGAKVTGYTR